MADRQGSEPVKPSAEVTSAAGDTTDNEIPTEVEKTSVVSTITSAAWSLATTAVVYAFGYWRVAAVSTWVLLPLMACVSVVRDRWREAGRIRRRRAQLAAVADEQTLVTANVSELPSWVFFPDIHRAEWLNQVFTTKFLCMPFAVLSFAYITVRLSNKCGHWSVRTLKILSRKLWNPWLLRVYVNIKSIVLHSTNYV